MSDLGLDPIIRATLVALGVGLLIGIERERSKSTGPDRDIAGVRTFVLVALLGVLATLLGTPMAILLGAAMALLAVAGYVKGNPDDPGITTETALLLTFALGAAAVSYPTYSAAVGVVATAILASRSRLHDLVKNRLTDRELQDALLLLGSVLVVLPMLPDRTLDPWNVLNPRTLWMIVVVVMTLNAVAYLALRLLGPRRGLMLAGLLGGFVSSTSTHVAMAQRATAQPLLASDAAAAANLSSVATALLMFLVVGAIAPTLSLSLAVAFAAAGLASALYCVLLLRSRHREESGELALGRPLSPKAALSFAVILTVVLFATTALERTLGSSGALLGSALAGLVDSHSGAISSALLFRRSVIDIDTARLAVLLAFTSNAAVKVAVSCFLGPRAFWQHILIGVAMSVSAGWLGWWVTH